MTAPSVLVVTSELVGPFRNGGIGTATTGLVETLAGAGCQVTVLYTGAIWHIEIDMDPWVESYRRIGVELVALALDDMKRLAGPVAEQGLGSAWLVHEFARVRQFDIIHVNDTLGEGMLLLTARHLGAEYRRTTVMVGLHSPTRWVMRLNRQLANNPVYAAFDWAERISVKSADRLWGPSRYLLDWIRAEGWTLPAPVEQRYYVMPTAELFEPGTDKFERADAPPAPRRIDPVAEIVFFGRLEERKGLRSFCAALDRLGDRLSGAGVHVTFLGKPVQQGDETSDVWLRRRGASWRFPWRLETGFGQREALAYLKGRASVAVMPSPGDNSPCTIYEALQCGIPFLASATGGIPELVHPDDHGRALFADDSDGLTDALSRTLDSGAATVRPRVKPADCRAAWRDLHLGWQAPAPRPPPVSRASFVVLVDLGADDAGLEKTVRSVRAVLGDRVRKIVVLAERAPANGPPEGAVVLDTGRERRVDTALSAALDGEADWVLCVAGGATIEAAGLPGLISALAAPDIGAGLIPAGITPDNRIVPPFAGRAFGFFEGFAFTGGAVLARSTALAAIAAGGTLIGSPFAGLVDLVAAADGELWPLPVVLFALPARMRAPVSLDGARLAAFQAADPVERGLIAAVGLAAYRRPFPNRKRRLLLALARLPGAAWATAAIRRARRFRR